MRKRYFLVLVALISIFITVYFLTLSTPFSVLNEPDSQNETQDNKNPFNFIFPWQSGNPTSESGSSGSIGSSGGESGGSSSANQTVNNTPKINYTLSLESGFGDIDLTTFYYEGNVLRNITQKTPYSIDIEAGTKACVVEISNYTGYYWTLDNVPYDMSGCNNYSNGIIINMDNPHNATLWQNS